MDQTNSPLVGGEGQ